MEKKPEQTVCGCGTGYGKSSLVTLPLLKLPKPDSAEPAGVDRHALLTPEMLAALADEPDAADKE